MMIATCAKKKCCRHLDYDIKTQDIAIKTLCGGNIAYFQVEMADACPGRYDIPWFGLLGILSEAAQIDRFRSHDKRALCPTPCLSGTIPVEFQAVFVGVRDIKRFTDQMITMTNFYIGLGKAQKHTTKVRTGRQNDGNMVEAGCSNGVRASAGNLN